MKYHFVVIMKIANILIAAVALGVCVTLTNAQSKGCTDGQTWSTNDWACSGPHTMCLYDSQDPASACGGWRQYGLTDEQRQTIVDRHNELRAKVASGSETRGDPGPQPAGDIPPLEWDDELAAIAQTWASQCHYGHDKCRNEDQYQVGQNIAYIWSDDLSEVVDNWYKEVDNWDCHNVQSNVFAMNTGHYSQLVWGETTKVGCGYVEYQDPADNYPEGWRHYLVCNYGPSGNLPGAVVYNTPNGGC